MGETGHTAGLIGSVLTRHWLDPRAVAIWQDRATMQTWLDVEAALAKAQGELGLIPKSSAAIIAAKADVGFVDFDRFLAETAHTLHPFVPLLRQFEEACGEPHAGFIHWGATTQNIFDTASALQMKRTHALVRESLDLALASLADLARRHRATPQAGRTHGQHALPITFGFKVAGWVEELLRHRERLLDVERRAFAVSMGGAVGAFNAMEGKGRRLQKRLADMLGLVDPGIPSRASADRTAEYVSLLALLAATIGRIAQDIVFLQRTEIGEVFESFHHGKVGSSTMAQKRNPSATLNLIGLATLIRSRVNPMLETMQRLDEGDAGLSNVGDAVLPEAAILGASIVKGLAHVAIGLGVDEAAMSRNLGATRGLIVTEAVMMHLGRELGRHRAHEVLYEAAMQAFETGRPLGEVLADLPEVNAVGGRIDLAGLLDPASYLGEAPQAADQAVADAGAALGAIRKAAE
jgi:3-carboxy-cis,cis-muconate cycloisomerase